MNTLSLPLNSGARSAHANRVSVVREFVRALFEAISVWHHRHVTRRELLALDDRMLLDMGLSRADAANYRGDFQRDRR